VGAPRRAVASQDLRAPIWRSGFRPFFLLGALFGPLALGAWYGAQAGAWAAPGPLALWHGHEMVFGFLVAIISGLLLTALPSWAGVEELAGRNLALLAGVWAAGRVAMACASFLPYAVVAAIDVAALPLLASLLASGLWRVPQRKFLVVVPVLAALATADFAFHSAVAAQDPERSAQALAAGVGIVVVLFSLVGGFMTPVFTNNALRERGSPHRAWRNTRLDVAAHAIAIAFALTHALPVAKPLAAVVGLAACAIHAVRLAGWQGYRARHDALVLGMHAGYAWLVAMFGIGALADAGLAFGARDWIHAATIGAFGTMMLALMPRVSLRHTGRALAQARGLIPTYVAMALAALFRLAYGASGATWTLGAAAMLWMACFGHYVAIYGPMLVRPSLPRSPGPGLAVS
jgi:uncharacterized protein involved in response to NO